MSRFGEIAALNGITCLLAEHARGAEGYNQIVLFVASGLALIALVLRAFKP